MITNKIKMINFKLFKIKNKFTILFHQKKFVKLIGIVSCDNLKNKVKEDLYLKNSLNKMNIDAQIISWQDKNIDFKKYDALVIRTIWGYNNNLKEFNDWLDYIQKNNIKIFNNIEIIKDNFDKEKQFNILDKYNIKHVDTKFIDKNDVDEIQKMLEKYGKIVIKPSISESGQNTYVINDSLVKNNININEISNKFENIKSKLMIQPFIEEVNNGEISLSYINGKLMNIVLRYCNIFSDKNYAENIDLKNIDKSLIDLSNTIVSINEYKDALYVRLDFVKVNNNYEIMEIELLDPTLFLTFIKNKKEMKEAFDYFAKSIISKI